MRYFPLLVLFASWYGLSSASARELTPREAREIASRPSIATRARRMLQGSSPQVAYKSARTRRFEQVANYQQPEYALESARPPTGLPEARPYPVAPRTVLASRPQSPPVLRRLPSGLSLEEQKEIANRRPLTERVRARFGRTLRGSKFRSFPSRTLPSTRRQPLRSEANTSSFPSSSAFKRRQEALSASEAAVQKNAPSLWQQPAIVPLPGPLHSGFSAHPAVDLDRAGFGMAPIEGHGIHLDKADGWRQQLPKHRVADRLSDGAGGQAGLKLRDIHRIETFERDGRYVPSKLFRPIPSLRHVTSIFARGGRVLVGTTGGLLVTDAEGSGGKIFLPGVQVSSISHDLVSPEAALVATNRGLFRFYRDTVTQHTESATTSALAVPSRGLLLTGHRFGVLQWLREGKQQRLTRIQTRSPLRFLAVHEKKVFCGNGDGLWSVEADGAVFEEHLSDDTLAHPVTWLGVHDHSLYVGTPGGLFRREEGQWKPVGESIHVLGAASLEGVLYVGTDGDGTWLLDGDTLTAVPQSVSSATAFAASQGSLLIGTRDSGASRVWWEGDTVKAGLLYPIDEAPPGNQIMGLAYASEHRRLFVGTYDHGVGRLDPNGRWDHIGTGTGIPSLWTNEVATDGRRVLVRVSDGTVAQSRNGYDFKVQGPSTGWPKTWTSIVGNAENDLFVGTHDGFYLGDPRGSYDFRFPVDALKHKMVLAAARKGPTTYVGTHKSGLYIQENRGGAWKQFSAVTGLPDSWIRCLTWFRGSLWLGTFNAGLVVLPHGSTDPNRWLFTREDEG